MRGSWRWCGVMLLLLAATACTQDFSSFHFSDSRPARNTRNPSTEKDAGSSGQGLGAGAAADAAQDVDSGLDAARPVAEAAVPEARDSGGDLMPPVDAAIPDAKVIPVEADDEDAGVPQLSLPEQCTTSWSDPTGPLECRSCACSACATPLVACLTLGDETQRRLCRDALSCAITNHCQVGDCYCATSTCGWGTSSGDGVCASAFEAAAGGKRTRVYELQQQDPPPLDQPFVRAIQAIGCLYGTDDAAPGPTLPPTCAAACQ